MGELIPIPAGSNVATILALTCDPILRPNARVWMHGVDVTEIEGFHSQEGDRFVIALRPLGGGGKKSGLGAILAIAVAVVAWYAAPVIFGGAGAFGAAGWAGLSGASLIAAQVGAMAINMIGSMMISALVPPPKISTGNGKSTEVAQSYQITGQSNQARQFGPVLKLYGRHRMMPLLASNPIVDNVGKDSKFSQLFDWGFGDVLIDQSSLTIGDVPMSQYNPKFYIYRNQKNPALKLVTNRFGFDQFSVKLEQGSPFTIRTKPDTNYAEITLAFQTGLVRYKADGGTTTQSVGFRFRYRVLGASTWEVLPMTFAGAPASSDFVDPSKFTVTDKQQNAFNFVVTMDFPGANQFEILIERTTADSDDTKIRDDAILTLLESRVAGDVIKLQRPHTLMEARFVGTDKLNGTVQNLSGIGTSVLRTTTNGTTFANQATRNPAWICVDLLTGDVNPRPLKDSQIDWPSWIAFAAYCGQQITRTVNGFSIPQARHSCDVVVDYEVTVGELIDSILSSCRASRMVTRGGKYGVLIDRAKNTPRQIITPKNSWDFSGNRTFSNSPHALRVSYIDGDKMAGSGFETWNRSEIIVYRDGYNSTNAVNYEDLGSFGLTDYAQAWSFGRYMMAQGVFRGEIFTMTMDVENLACNRGDLVDVQHDVPMVGGVTAYVKARSGNDVTITEILSTMPGSYTVRLATGSIRTGAVVGFTAEDTLTLDNATGIQVGDLIVMGETNRVTSPYLIQSITPAQDLTATLTLCRYVPSIYNVDTDPIPEYFPDFGDDLINVTDLAVISFNVAAQQTVYVDRRPIAEFVMTWNLDGWAAGYYELLVTFENGESELIQGIQGFTYTYRLDLISHPGRVGVASFVLTPFTSSGLRGSAATDTSAVVVDVNPPAAVIGFGMDVQDMTIMFFWQLSTAPDVNLYVLRYSPDIENGTWETSQLIGTYGWDISRATVGARTGLYMIRAVDTSGNGGPITSRRTTIETLPNVNFVTSVNDAPLFEGTMSNVVKVGDTVQSGGDFGAVEELGYYTFKSNISLGSVSEVRLSSKIQAHGETDLIDPVQAGQWNTRLEYRVVDTTVSMSQWIPLSNPIADPISGASTGWSEWRPIEVGDVTGRLIGLRVKMESFSANVKAVLTDALVEIDAPDRTLKGQNLNVPVAGVRVEFITPFMFKPTVVITIDNAVVNLRYQVSAVDKYGFNVNLYNIASGAATAGVVDWAALGAGKIRTAAI
jgi:predicted phage tail protein